VRRPALSTLALATLAVLLGTGGAAAATAGSVPVDREAGPAPRSAESPNGRVIVQWRRGSDHSERAAARADAEVSYTAELGDPSFQLVEAEGDESAAAAAAALAEDPAVAVAEPDGMRRLEAVPNDPLFGLQWALQNTGQAVAGLPAGKTGNDIDVVPAWDRAVGTPGTVVADIDTGYRFDSPDLGPVAWTNPGEIPGNGIDDDGDGYIDDVHGWDFVGASAASPSEDPDPTDDNLTSGGHGVHTAGIIGAAGNNGTGISGVARNARIMPLRVCTNEPATNEVRCPFSAIVAAINYAGDHGARVANLSLGGTVFSQLEVNAYAAHPGTFYVIAAGNDAADDDSGEAGTKGHHYPCDYLPAVESSPAEPGAIENTICVAALGPSEALAPYSDYGAQSVDLAAPGTAVLSTFPATQALFSDNFEAEDFGTRWTPYGAGFGRALAGDGPLTSAGITDTPGAASLAGHTYGVQASAAVAVPAGSGACRLEGRRFREGGGPNGAPYGLIVGGAFREFFGPETTGAAMVPFHTVPITGLAGQSVTPFFEYLAGSAPTETEGEWLDDISLNCNAPLSVPPVYAYDEGTSMAAPQVTGAAALLFSLEPGASVTAVREALLDSTVPVAGLAGKTVTGGRLDVAAALDLLVPSGTETTAPDTELTTTTPAVTGETVARFHASRLDADGGTIECSLGTEAFKACGAELEAIVKPGTHTLRVRAKNEAGIVDPTPASFTWTVTGPSEGTGGGGGDEELGVGPGEVVVGTLPPGALATIEEEIVRANPPAMPQPAPVSPVPARGCVVPKLVGKTLGGAKAALAGAGCKLGRLASPKVARGTRPPKLVVASSTPAAGSRAGNDSVALKLAAKPRRHHH
jgi:subtilisin family serine protease